MDKYHLVGIVLLVGGTLLYSLFASIPKLSKNHSTDVSDSLSFNSVVVVKQTIPYLEIAKKVASEHTYDLYKYNCLNFALELKKELMEVGYKATLDTGIVDCNSGLFDEKICKLFGGTHNWVSVYIDGKEIWIEATNGEVITDRSVYHLSYRG